LPGAVACNPFSNDGLDIKVEMSTVVLAPNAFTVNVRLTSVKKSAGTISLIDVFTAVEFPVMYFISDAPLMAV
jgi:hypothetical protein